MDIRKVHEGLRDVDAATTYHLGFYEVDFPDGLLVFQLHARICGDPNCVCDDLFLQFRTDTTCFEAWYTAYRQWKDKDYADLDPDLVQVFRIVETTETFRERYNHLMYLRRSQVLKSLKREKDFEVLFPAHLLEDSADLARGIMGRIATPDSRLSVEANEAWSWKLELCGDPECHCEDLFLLARPADVEVPIRIESDGKWVALSSEPHAQLIAQIFEKQLAGDGRFQELLRFMRGERRLENYSRFIATYEQGLLY